MKHCTHAHWLSLREEGSKSTLVQSDRFATLVQSLPKPDTQRPRLFVLVGSVERSIAARALFGLKKVWAPSRRRRAGEVHLHLDAATAFSDQPVLLADSDVHRSSRGGADARDGQCHETTCRVLSARRPAGDVLAGLLAPFAEVVCFFSDDLGFRHIAQRLAQWLEQDSPSTLPRSALPSVVIVSSRFPARAEAEAEAETVFLRMLGEETSRDPFQQVSAIEVVALLPNRAISPTARYRRVRERLMRRSDQVRAERTRSRMLFSATHLAAFVEGAGEHFADATGAPFDFVKASRVGNAVAPDLAEHLSTFVKHVTSAEQLTQFAAPAIASSLFLDCYPPDAHVFDPRHAFRTLYVQAVSRVSEARIIHLERSDSFVLRSGVVKMIEEKFVRCFEQFVGGETAVAIHRSNLARSQGWWRGITSNDTCLCCLRRRPQYGLPCGHSLCENCIVVFGDRSDGDPWLFDVRRCFLCGQVPSVCATVRVHPPTAGAGVLCIDGGGTRGIVPLVMMKLIHDRIGLPIPLQRFVKVAFGVSIGAVIAIDHYINGRTLTESIQMFPGMMDRVFKRRTSLRVPFVSRAIELATSYLGDGLYSTGNIESALKDAFGTDKTIQDCSYANSTGTKVGLPVATVGRHPSYRIFTNYNGVGSRSSDGGKSIVRPTDEAGRVPLWKINRARAATAAPLFFAPEYIEEVGTFQDPGLLENDPVLSALAEASTLFPLAEQPDFVVSLGTGEPSPSSYETSTGDCRSIRRNGMCQRVMDLLNEKTRDTQVRKALNTTVLTYRTARRIHRLNLQFHGAEPRLDDTRSIPKLITMVQTDPVLCAKIDAAARSMVASLFYFELVELRKYDGKHRLDGRILCTIRAGAPALEALLSKLASSHARFLVDDRPVWSAAGTVALLSSSGNVSVPVTAESSGQLAISLQLGDTEACSISGSPFSMPKLAAAQDAPFGRPDHRKRKAPEDGEGLASKRQRRS